MQAEGPGGPRVSVLIGCWNNAETLPRAIESILSQSLGDLELIVVDDGSTDPTPEVVGAISDPRLRYLPLDHAGISESLNRGLAEARAPIVAVQDADDWSLPERLDRELAVLDERPDVAVVGARMREVDPAGAELRPRTAFAAGEVNRALLRFNPIPNSCAAFDLVCGAAAAEARAPPPARSGPLVALTLDAAIGLLHLSQGALDRERLA